MILSGRQSESWEAGLCRAREILPIRAMKVNAHTGISGRAIALISVPNPTAS